VKSAESHKIKTLLGARDQLVRVKRSLGNQVRGLLRPFGLKLPSRAGMKKFAVAAHQAVQNDRLMYAGISALLEALASIDAQIVKLDAELKELAQRNEGRLLKRLGVSRQKARPSHPKKDPALAEAFKRGFGAAGNHQQHSS
jgi:transposase